MSIVRIKRAFQNHDVTLGMLQVDDLHHVPIFTLENPWMDNKPYVSCIPTGEYHCVPFSGQRYKGVYEVLNVPKRSAILFHWGNWEFETQGCILLGLSCGELREKTAVINSKKAVEYLKHLLKYEPFDLIVE